MGQTAIDYCFYINVVFTLTLHFQHSCHLLVTDIFGKLIPASQYVYHFLRNSVSIICIVLTALSYKQSLVHAFMHHVPVARQMLSATTVRIICIVFACCC